MKLNAKISDFEFTGRRKLAIAKAPTSIDPLYKDKKDYRKRLEEYREEIDELQSMMYAHDRYSMLIIFQAMDAAGKDSTIKHVMSGINPHGVEIHAFKRPSDEELDHGFLWRTNVRMPPRGRIGIFNRSYYEEVLVARVHPGIVTGVQRLPAEHTKDLGKVWERRFADIRAMENYHFHNGGRILKFFLHVSKNEQARRFLSRLEEPDKNWKFSQADLKERERWGDYQDAYEEAINATAAKEAPWYVIPADDKKSMRLLVGHIVLENLRKLKMAYPKVGADQRDELAACRDQLKAELEG